MHLFALIASVVLDKNAFKPNTVGTSRGPEAKNPPFNAGDTGYLWFIIKIPRAQSKQTLATQLERSCALQERAHDTKLKPDTAK